MSIKALSDYTFYSRYSQYNKEESRRETWHEAVTRLYDMHRIKYSKEIEENPELSGLIDFAETQQKKKRVLASQRSLQFASEPILKHELKMFNCLFSYIDRERVFQEMMYSLLCGCGVGFSVQPQHINQLGDLYSYEERYEKQQNEKPYSYVIEDSIEGWADAVGVLISSWFKKSWGEFDEAKGRKVEFDFSKIRDEGSLIAGRFKAPGHKGLQAALEKIHTLLVNVSSEKQGKGSWNLSPINAYDIIMHISDAVLSGGVRRCIAEGSRVLVQDSSFKNIEDIKIGDMVSTDNGWMPVTNTFKQGLQKTVTIEHQDGILKCTPNHRVAVLTDIEGNFDWKNAEDLIEGDRLFFVNNENDHDFTNSLPKFEYVTTPHSTTCKDILIPELTEDVAWLLGEIHGGGYVRLTSKSGEVSVAIEGTYPDKAIKVSETLQQFGVNVTTQEPTETDNCYKVKVKSKQLAQYFSEWLKNPKTAIRVPECIKSSSSNIKAAYLQGVLDADGSIGDRCQMLESSIYEDFELDLQNLLYSIGIIGFKKFMLSKFQHRSNSYPMDFLKNVENCPKELSNSLDNIKPIEVVSVTEGLEYETYDLEVDGNHCFICEGVLVHNSATLCLFSKEDSDMMNAKTGNWFIDNPQRARSNNSVALLRGGVKAEEFANIMKSTREFGEPGFIWTDDLEIGFNPCLPKYAKVITKDGIRQFSEVDIGDQIWSKEGWTTVVNKWSTGVKPVYEYKTTGGTFYSTDNHRIVSGGVKIQVKDADSIDVLCGDVAEKIDIVTEDVMDGMVFGDGTVHKAGGNLVTLCIGEDDKDYFDSEVAELIVAPRPGVGLSNHEVTTTITHDELPLTYDRVIPDRFYYGTKSKVASFLRGLYTANGSICGNRVTLKGSSFKVIQQAQEMLSLLGIQSYYTTNKAKNVKFKNGEYLCKESYDLNITVDRSKFALIIGFIQGYKQNKLQDIADIKSNSRKVSYDIKEINFIAEEEVFDITVDNSSHTFWCGGFDTSNCVEIGLYPKTKDGKSGFHACNLSEINGRFCDSEENFLQACEASAIIGTLQAGYTNLKYLTDTSKEIFEQEALLGCSITGWMDNPDILFDKDIQRRGAEKILEVNEKVAKLIGIKTSARVTCVKPAGCQVQNTLVSTGEGILRLDEIGDITKADKEWQEIDLSVNTDDEPKRSPKFFINGFEKTKKIRLDSGLTLEGTYNHKYRVLTDDGDYLWKRSDELKVGDMLPYSIGEYKGTSSPITLTKVDYKFNNNTPGYSIKSIKQPDEITEDFAWFLGMYLRDGTNHKQGIRMVINKQRGVEKLKSVVKSLFGIEAIVATDVKEGNGCVSVYVNSKELLSYLGANNLLKGKDHDIDIPEVVRRSSVSVISSFIEGYAMTNGCDKSLCKTYCTTSERMAEELVIVLRAIGKDAKMRIMLPTPISYGARIYIDALTKNNLHTHSVDRIVEVQDSENETYDIEVDDTHTYLANSYISHNSTSCVLGTSSGIHPHHAKKYIRRTQVNKQEFCGQVFQEINPLSVEESVWSANKTDNVVSFLCEVPQGAITKNQVSALDLLEKVKLAQQNWVEYGTRVERCMLSKLRHNVSNTINVKDDEWEDVEKFIFDNQNFFAGISLLPASGDLDYAQAPFSTILTPNELVKEYGDASVFASGLVVDGLHAFDGDLWGACNITLGFSDVAALQNEPDYPKARNYKDLSRYFQLREEYENIELKHDWVRRVKQFADRYFDGNVKKATYCLKHVSLWKTWCDIKRNYVDIDWKEHKEDSAVYQSANELGAQACSGGKCEI